MQRLYGLRQLGLADRIFIDASHSRIHHVVGVLQQVDKLTAAIISNLRRSNRILSVGTSPLTQTFPASALAMFVRKRRPVIRFIGLLHDLTHAPFGHTVEDEIGLVQTKHDEPARQADAFYRALCQLIVWLSVEANEMSSKVFPKSLKPFLAQAENADLPKPSEVGALAQHLLCDVDPSTARLCWRLSQAEFTEMIAQLGCAMTALVHLEALHKMELRDRDLPSKDEYAFQTAIREALTPKFEPLLQAFDFQPNRDAFMLDIVGNTVCADLLDYAQRDSRFAGLKLDYDSDRIAENFTLVSLDASAYEVNHPQKDSAIRPHGRRVPQGFKDPFDGWCLRTAISLVSHKYRTDVPSELMNLLNVRYYLYERVVYHPTKCAADSMLGTALQLLGWRELENGQRPPLPDHLRFVGDDVFLHDIRAALDFLTDWISKVPDTDLIGAAHVKQVESLKTVHNGLVPTLLRLRVESTAKQTREELAAARLLLDRLKARRYFRPVFRALPNSIDARLQAGPEELAKFFLNPDTRYQAERKIEAAFQFSPGTVTIHCPARTTARKIANVLLTKPNEAGVDEVRKLQDIGSLDATIFGEHEKAVKAVEEMYRSMWRLTVYVAPEHLPLHEKISKTAGRVIFKTVDVTAISPTTTSRGRMIGLWKMN
jgi:HD superfamily phosphohydrolase